MCFQKHINRDLPSPHKENVDKRDVVVLDGNTDRDIRESLISTNTLIHDLSRTLDLNQEYISHILSNFKCEVHEMSIKDLASLNEMLVGACLKQLA